MDLLLPGQLTVGRASDEEVREGVGWVITKILHLQRGGHDVIRAKSALGMELMRSFLQMLVKE